MHLTLQTMLCAIDEANDYGKNKTRPGGLPNLLAEDEKDLTCAKGSTDFRGGRCEDPN